MKKLSKMFPLTKRILAMVMTLCLIAGLGISVFAGAEEPEVEKYAQDATLSLAPGMAVTEYTPLITNGVTDDGEDYYDSGNNDFSGGQEYYQLNWDTPVSINQVLLFIWNHQNAPTSWEIQVSEDGTTGWTKVAESGTVTWLEEYARQSREVNFDTAENIMGLRVVILSANFTSGWYGIWELEANYDPSAVVEDDDTDEPVLEKLTPSATLTLAPGMTESHMGSVNDGSTSTSYASENSDFSEAKEYYQLNWEAPVTVNQIVLWNEYIQQAPTSFDIYVSEDGTTGWTKVGSSGMLTWADDSLQAKTVNFETAEGVMGLRVVILSANMTWDHYCIYELEANYAVGGTGGGNTGNTDEKFAGSGTLTLAPGMTNDAMGSVNDGSTSSSYASYNTDFSDGKEYYQFNWEAPISINQVVLWSQYCDTPTGGQAPTAWEIQVSEDGTTGWTKVAESGTVAWEDNNDLQSRAVDFETAENIRGVRVVITSANMTWGHYCIYELEINYDADGEAGGGESGGGEEGGEGGEGEGGGTEIVPGDPSGVTDGKYGLCAGVSVAPGMTGELLGSVNDGNTGNSYSSDHTDFADGKEYIQMNWSAPIDINQVVLWCEYCNGQAPTAWDIYTSADGYTGWEQVATSGVVLWEADNSLQSKTVNFETAEGVMGLRVVICSAKLDWGHYCVYELEANYDPDANTGSGETEETLKKYATSGTLTLASGMTESLAGSVVDGNTTTSYASTNSNFAGGREYYQINWAAAIDINQVVLWSEYCHGQAPTNWDVYVSADGTGNWTRVARTGTFRWANSTGRQYRSLEFSTATGVKAVRVVINSANMAWGHYCVYEIEANYKPDAVAGRVTTDVFGGEYDDGSSYGSAEDSSETVGGVADGKFASSGTLTVAPDMDQSQIAFANDGRIDHNSYASTSNDFADGKQYLQFNWNEPIDINQVVLWSQFCTGQAPTSWDVYVSADGSTDWQKAASTGKVNWAAGDEHQSKSLTFELVEGIKGLRVVIQDANFEWGHYCIYELEVNNDPDAVIDEPPAEETEPVEEPTEAPTEVPVEEPTAEPMEDQTADGANHNSGWMWIIISIVIGLVLAAAIAFAVIRARKDSE